MTDAALNVDPSGVVTGVKRIETSLNELFRTFKTFTSSLDTLNNAATKSMGSMYDNLTATTTKGENGLASARLQALFKLKQDSKERLGLVSGENTEIQRLYESRLATASTLSNQELAIWKKFGASLGGIQKAQAEGTSLSYLQNRLVRAQEITDLTSHIANVEVAAAKLGTAYEKAVKGKKRSSDLKAQLKEAETEVAQSHAKLEELNAEFDRTDKDRITRYNAFMQAMTDQRLSEIAAAEKAHNELGLAIQEKYLTELELRQKAHYEFNQAMANQRMSEIAAEEKAKNTLVEGLQADMLKDELAFQTARSKIADGLHADMLKDETEFQTARNKIADGLQADMLKDELDFQTLRNKSAEGLQADMLKDELAFQKAREKYADALHDDMLRDEIRFQKERALAAKHTISTIEKDMKGISGGIHLRDVNAGLRGLTQGMGMLSTGISNMLPFLASFAAGAAFMKTLKVGAEFEQSLFVISELAGTSATGVRELSAEMLNLGKTTQYGPQQAAEGIKILTLAGLNAKEALLALKPTLDFAAAGEVTMDAAAATLVAVSTAYGFSAQQFSIVGDIIAKTAADSMASVTGMSESFKTASVVAQTYGISLTDTAHALAALSQIGIQGSAAGTSLRNFYTEITKQSGKVAVALKAMKVEIYESAKDGGALKSQLEIVKDLAIAYAKLDTRNAKKLFADITNERGGKLASAEVYAFNKAVAASTNATVVAFREQEKELRTLGKAKEADIVHTKMMTAAYEEIKQKAEESTANAAGFTFFAGIEAQLTSMGAYKGILASFQTDFVTAFSKSSDSVYVLGVRLREVLNSKEFGTAIETIFNGMLKLTSIVVEVINYFSKMEDGFLRFASTVTAAVTGITVAVTAISTSFGLAATGALTLGTAIMGTIAAAPVSIALLVAAVAALGYSWLTAADNATASGKQQSKAAMEAAKSSVEALRLKDKQFNESMDSEIARLTNYLGARARGDDAQKAADKAMGESALLRVNKIHDENKSLITNIALLEHKSRLESGIKPADSMAKMMQDIELRTLANEQARRESLAKTSGQVALLIALKKEEQRLALEDAKHKPATGDGTYNSPDRGAMYAKGQLDGLLNTIKTFAAGTDDMERSLSKLTVAETFENKALTDLDKLLANHMVTKTQYLEIKKQINAESERRGLADETVAVNKLDQSIRSLNAGLKTELESSHKLTEAEKLDLQLRSERNKADSIRKINAIDRMQDMNDENKLLEKSRVAQEEYNKAVAAAKKSSSEVLAHINTIKEQAAAETAMEGARAEALRTGPEFLAQ